MAYETVIEPQIKIESGGFKCLMKKDRVSVQGPRNQSILLTHTEASQLMYCLKICKEAHDSHTSCSEDCPSDLAED